ncbi:MAG: hypothetical protein GY716_06890 [bacterium]|nr:hypothetical protein [bacterium]
MGEAFKSKFFDVANPASWPANAIESRIYVLAERAGVSAAELRAASGARRFVTDCAAAGLSGDQIQELVAEQIRNTGV